jgi:hypothetical protein
MNFAGVVQAKGQSQKNQIKNFFEHTRETPPKLLKMHNGKRGNVANGKGKGDVKQEWSERTLNEDCTVWFVRLSDSDTQQKKKTNKWYARANAFDCSKRICRKFVENSSCV